MSLNGFQSIAECFDHFTLHRAVRVRAVAGIINLMPAIKNFPRDF